MKIIKLLIFAIALVNGDKWMQLQRFPSFDSKVCRGSEIAFSRENIFDRSICLIECSKYQNCKSVFHAQQTGMCTGCTENYDLLIHPTGTAEGTTYYGYIGCPEGWFRIENSCYTPTGDMTFDEGVENCKNMNAYPVVMETEVENESLKSKLRQLRTTADAADAYFTAYIDTAAEGTWVVRGTNEPFQFQDWGNGEPQGGTTENCMAFFNSIDFKWVDIDCYTTQKTLCEKKALP